jgi:serine/threonine-protein kinase
MSDTPVGLDKAMERAYGKKGGKGKRGEEWSVLAALEALSGSVSRVLLRDGDAGPAPLVKPGGERPDSGRYEIVGEIARGGVGVVLKGRDPDLGREVALKVLRRGHAKNPELLQRFVEEAQIGGQLQHPGIVPVYELGLNADEEPFFTMKLVKGKTLSALLQERSGLDQDRARYLAVFQQVCQTMAYAHSRGVIHRDLKPSNVMVGAFGEVQVVDWGFAKVLRQGGIDDERRTLQGAAAEQTIVETVRSGSVGSESCAGSVMGTPAYMPPEQARGDIEKLTERSDVFSLGAILCEVLTGLPPYHAKDVPLLVQAAKTQLDAARERLDACGADKELVDLVLRCLTPSPTARPAHAGELAEAVGQHLAAVEERAKTAAREADAARIRASEERKRRIVTATLSSIVLVAVVLCGLGLFWLREERGKRRELARAPVDAALEEASILRGKARENIERWKEALKQAELALGLARAEDIDPALRARIERLIGDMRAERERAVSDEATRRRDRRLVARLLEIYTWRGDDFASGEQERAYAEALSDYGIPSDPDAQDEAIAMMRASAVKDQIVLALDDRGLHDLAADVDRDVWRGKVRAFAGKADALRELADTEVDENRSARDLMLLAESLARAGAVVRARDIYDEARRRDAGSFRIRFGLAWWLGQRPAQRETRAARLMHASATAKPSVLGARYAAGVALQAIRDERAAVDHLRFVYARDPDFARIRSRLADVLGALATRGGSRFNVTDLELLQQAVELAPDDAANLGNLALTYFRDPELRHDQEARAAALRALALIRTGEFQFKLAHRSAWALLVIAQTLGPLRLSEEALEAFRLAAEAAESHNLAGVAAAARNQLLTRLVLAGKHAEALAMVEKMPTSPVREFYEGSSLFDAGRPEAGIAKMKAALAARPQLAVSANFGQRLAHVLRMAGDHSAAQETLESAANALQGTGGVYYVQALLQAGRYAEARKALEAMAGQPVLRAYARFFDGDYAGCIESANELALAHPPNEGTAKLGMYVAMSHWKLGNLDAARQRYETAKRFMEQRDLGWDYRAREAYAQARRMIEGQ